MYHAPGSNANHPLISDGEDDDGGGEELWPFERDPRYWGALAVVFAGADPPSPPPALPPADVLGCQPLYTLSALMGRYGGPSVDVQLVQCSESLLRRGHPTTGPGVQPSRICFPASSFQPGCQIADPSPWGNGNEFGPPRCSRP